ncbi:MAG: hypothetical protein E6J01_06175 [Chloroflexi bacterium]|nr:MAG: hypothetical protein E6J01_06175 [Chloroflexota bacterium]
MVQGRVKRAQRTDNVFAFDPKVEAGAGDETRTRDFNLGMVSRYVHFEKSDLLRGWDRYFDVGRS